MKRRSDRQRYRDEQAFWPRELEKAGINLESITSRRDVIKAMLQIRHNYTGWTLRHFTREAQWQLRIRMPMPFTHRLFPRGFWLGLWLHRLRSGKVGSGLTFEEAMAKLDRENKRDAARRFQANRMKWLRRPLIDMGGRGKVTLKAACQQRASEFGLDADTLYQKAKSLFLEGTEASEALGLAMNEAVQAAIGD